MDTMQTMKTTKENPRIEQLLIDALGLKSAEERFRVPLDLRVRFPQLNDKTTLVLYHDLDREPIPKSLAVAVGSYPIPLRVSGWEARFWRVIGELFDRDEWRERGWDRHKGVGRSEKAIPVENIGWRFYNLNESAAGRLAQGAAFVAYLPDDDRLYIWTRPHE